MLILVDDQTREFGGGMDAALFMVRAAVRFVAGAAHALDVAVLDIVVSRLHPQIRWPEVSAKVS